MSIRLGTSTVLLRRAKLRRVRRASTAAKKTTPSEGERRAEEGAEGRPAKIANAIHALKGCQCSRTPPSTFAYVARRRTQDGCGYRPAADSLPENGPL